MNDTQIHVLILSAFSTPSPPASKSTQHTFHLILQIDQSGFGPPHS